MLRLVSRPRAVASRGISEYSLVVNPASGLLSMLRSDWLSCFSALCYSPLAAKSAGFETQTMAAESRFANLSCFISSRYF